MTKPFYSGGQYSLLRFFLGAYLCLHFLHLLPYGREVFSSQGLPARASDSPLMGLLPNSLSLDAPWAVNALLIVGALCGLLLVIGYWHRLAALLAALVLAWLFARNPLIANPSLPVVGWLLIAHLFVPPRPYGAWDSRNDAEAWSRWQLPGSVFVAAWVVLALAYSYSGYTKLLSLSWVDGQTIAYVLNPLARDHLLSDWLLAMPDWVLRGLTLAVLYIELLFAPLALFKRLRPLLWTLMLIVQFGFLLFLNFADLTFPMLLIHLLTFDRRWLPEQRKARAATLFFDGYCALCNRLVRFALAEDVEKRLQFAPLQGETFERANLPAPADDTIVLIDEHGRRSEKSTATAEVMILMGGVWQVLGYLLLLLPRALRDGAYDFVGRMRYRAGKLPQVCQTIPLAYRDRMQF